MAHLHEIVGQQQPPRQEVCDKHGAFESKNLFRNVWTRCPICSKERDEAIRAEAEAEKARERERKHREALHYSAIPARFIGRTFDNYRATTNEQRQALTVARDYSENFDRYAAKGQGLVFMGKPGTGKSHLAAAILQVHMQRNVRYMTCLDLIRAIRETWRRDSERSERKVLDIIRGLELLVLDEVGAQYGTEGEQTILFDVLDMRYRDLTPTVILSNQHADGLKAYLGERTFDRLRETSQVVQFLWDSHRPQARGEAA
jgi:DNA replication protein DnaC